MAAGGRVSFPAGARRTVADIKEIAGGHTDEEVYAMLRECNMDPNETVQRLLLQDTFHEVKRKRDRKKEGSKEPSDCRWRPSLQGRGGKSSQRNYCSRNFSGFNGRCAISGKENVINHIMGNDSGSTLAINRNIDVKASTSTPSSSSNLAIGPSQPFDHATVVVTSSSAHQPLRPASDSVVVPSLDPHGPGDGGAAKQAIGSNKISVEHKVCRDVPMDNKVIPSKEWKPKLTSSAASQATKNVAIPNDVPVAVDTIPQSSATVEKSFNGLRLSKQHVIIPDHIQVSESEKCSFIFGSINASLQQTMGSSDAECAKSSLPDYNATHELNGSDDEPQPMQRNQNSSSPVQEADSVTQPSPQIAQKMSLSFTSENDFEVKVVKDLKVKRGTATNGADSQSTQFATRASLPNDEKTPGTLVIRRSARPSIFTSKQAQVLHERFLAFLQGYQDSGCYYYREIASIMSRFGMSTMYIHYDHVGLFDQALAGTVRIFYDSVQTIMLNAVEVFLNTETGSQWTNPLVKICDLPICNSFTPLTQFWNLPGHHPSEEVVISSGDSAVTVVKATPVGRIPFLNLLLKIFETHGRGKTWGGKWDINDVMTNSNYEVEILKPYCKTFKKKYMLKDFLRCAEDVIPELQIGGQLWSGLSLSVSFLGSQLVWLFQPLTA